MTANAPPEDDEGIDDGQNLLRRINPDWVKADGSITSQAFQNQTGNAFSIIISCLLDDPPDYNALLEGLPGFKLASFTVEQARSLGQGVTHEPEPDEPAHGHVNGDKTKAIRRKFAGLAKMVPLT